MVVDDSGLILTGIKNLTIRGVSGGLDGRPEIVVDPRGVFVMTFINCEDIVIDGIAAGHSESTDECSGGVFYFSNSSRITVNNAAMYGSGIEGIFSSYTDDLKVTDSRIYQCTRSIARIIRGAGIAFENCVFDNNRIAKDEGLLVVGDVESPVTFTDCEFRDNEGTALLRSYGGAAAVLSRCKFVGNKIERINYDKDSRAEFSGCEFDIAIPDEEDGAGDKLAAAEAAQDGEAEKPSDERLLKHIPAGYEFFNKARGDLNGDGAEDCALIIKGTDQSKIDELGRDFNDHGVMIFFGDGGGGYKLAAENRAFLGPDEYDGANCAGGGEFSIEIKKGNLYIKRSDLHNCSYARETSYTFRYKNSEFELIGYDKSYIIETREDISINFPAKKKLEKECVGNLVSDEGDCDYCTKLARCTKYKETWSAIATDGPILLRKIKSRDDIPDKYIK